jgi:hypothetical protein
MGHREDLLPVTKASRQPSMSVHDLFHLVEKSVSLLVTKLTVLLVPRGLTFLMGISLAE